MEPIQTPTNEALNFQIEALKARMFMLEMTALEDRKSAMNEHLRTIDFILQVSRRHKWLEITSLFTLISIIIHCFGHILTSWGK